MKSIKTSNLAPNYQVKSDIFSKNFLKSHFPKGILKIKSQRPNLTSNFETYKNVGDKL